MVPPDTSFTAQPACVQVAENALIVPSLGWVMTTPLSAKTTPPPTGMSDTSARASVTGSFSAGGSGRPEPEGAGAAGAPVASAIGGLFTGCCPPYVSQPARAVAAPTAPTAASTDRRVRQPTPQPGTLSLSVSASIPVSALPAGVTALLPLS
jgi:hypothetical protein